jgi:hypothetical protein
MTSRLILWVLLIFAPLASAAPIEREVGNGLIYLRVRELPADLPARTGGRVAPCVVDLRYVETNAEGAAAFGTWIKSRATRRTPVFVVANADTARPLLKELSTLERGNGVVVVGIPRGAFKPDVAVTASAEDERRAYDALERGVAIGALRVDNPNKVRNDEASLSKDRLAEASADTTDTSKKEERPPVDAALQRAVHLHRALVALKRL